MPIYSKSTSTLPFLNGNKMVDLGLPSESWLCFEVNFDSTFNVPRFLRANQCRFIVQNQQTTQNTRQWSRFYSPHRMTHNVELWRKAYIILWINDNKMCNGRRKLDDSSAAPLLIWKISAHSMSLSSCKPPAINFPPQVLLMNDKAIWSLLDPWYWSLPWPISHHPELCLTCGPARLAFHYEFEIIHQTPRSFYVPSDHQHGTQYLSQSRCRQCYVGQLIHKLRSTFDLHNRLLTRRWRNFNLLGAMSAWISWWTTMKCPTVDES